MRRIVGWSDWPLTPEVELKGSTHDCRCAHGDLVVEQVALRVGRGCSGGDHLSTRGPVSWMSRPSSAHRKTTICVGAASPQPLCWARVGATLLRLQWSGHSRGRAHVPTATLALRECRSSGCGDRPSFADAQFGGALLSGERTSTARARAYRIRPNVSWARDPRRGDTMSR